MRGLGSGCAAIYVYSDETVPDTAPVGCGKGQTELQALKYVERVKGIEPSLSAWESDNEGG